MAPNSYFFPRSLVLLGSIAFLISNAQADPQPLISVNDSATIYPVTNNGQYQMPALYLRGNLFPSPDPAGLTLTFHAQASGGIGTLRLTVPTGEWR